jgi:hypothetical protein
LRDETDGDRRRLTLDRLLSRGSTTYVERDGEVSRRWLGEGAFATVLTTPPPDKPQHAYEY